MERSELSTGAGHSVHWEPSEPDPLVPQPFPFLLAIASGRLGNSGAGGGHMASETLNPSRVSVTPLIELWACLGSIQPVELFCSTYPSVHPIQDEIKKNISYSAIVEHWRSRMVYPLAQSLRSSECALHLVRYLATTSRENFKAADLQAICVDYYSKTSRDRSWQVIANVIEGLKYALVNTEDTTVRDRASLALEYLSSALSSEEYPELAKNLTSFEPDLVTTSVG